jgi:hypothetical protein
MSHFRFFAAAIGLLALVSACARPSPQQGGAAAAAVAAAATAPVAGTLEGGDPRKQANPAFNVNGEVARLKAALKREVPNLIVDTPRGSWVTLGGTRVSTGQPGRFDYYVTPARACRQLF